MTMDKQQLELTFDGSTRFHPEIRQRRPSRARWWFARMRRVVDLALDWRPAPAPRPEQIQLALVHGH